MMIDDHLRQIAEVLGKPAEFLKKAAVCLKINNVAQWLYEESPEEYDGMNDFPNLAPPWPIIWAEYQMPKLINQSNKISNNKIEQFIKTVGIYQEATWHEDLQKYTVNLVVITKNKDGYLWPLAELRMGVFRDGKLVDKCYFGHGYTRVVDNLMKKMSIGRKLINQSLVDQAESLSKSFYFAISLIHCKNITIKESDANIKLNRKRQKMGKIPYFRFNTVQINPMREILRKEGESQTLGLTKALHICRGHFATYTQEAPLFGRVTGTFWKPMHVRGNAKEGVVVKDYKILPPSPPVPGT